MTGDLKGNITAPRMTALRMLAYGPIPNLPRPEKTKCWQLYRRGLADYDGRGWRLTEQGREVLANVR